MDRCYLSVLARNSAMSTCACYHIQHSLDAWKTRCEKTKRKMGFSEIEGRASLDQSHYSCEQLHLDIIRSKQR